MTSEEIPVCGPAVSCCCSCACFLHRQKLLDPSPDLSSPPHDLVRALGWEEDIGRFGLRGLASLSYNPAELPGLTQSQRVPYNRRSNRKSHPEYPVTISAGLAILGLGPRQFFVIVCLYLRFLVSQRVEYLDFIRELLLGLLLVVCFTLRKYGEFPERSWIHSFVHVNLGKFSTGIVQSEFEAFASLACELRFVLSLTRFDQLPTFGICYQPGYTSERPSVQVKIQAFLPPLLQVYTIRFPQTLTKLWDASLTLISNVCDLKTKARILTRSGVFCQPSVTPLTTIFPLVATLGRAHYAPRLLQHLPMGCILPKRQKNLGLEGDIKVYDLHAIIDPHPTTLIENSPTVLKYQTPHFRASARVRFPPVSGNDTWQIGWVQGCSNMDFTISYGNLGTSSWEIPSLKSNQQRFVSDSDGKHYPWYGCTTEVATIPGPTSCYSTFHLRMNDNFHPSITWDIPVRNSHQVRLTKLARDQSFTVWLVAMNKSTGQKFVLRTIKWRMRINIAVDETQPLGRRARLLDPIIQEQPHILEPWQNEVAPPEALRAPNANNAQTLIWRPTSGGEVVIVPPVSHH
ncbi:uncharacterized protein LOC110976303 isoform X1 [Acanthaster planci]|uniref:Uncharacterized protein LOC110976303 isoform X1 n=1 Tax=Acanthaster planci TaxID=133434 RepID=A0A8B7XZG0_ACAPL|nr:uncharacterized protein LOC110976303 isoform X1 [Acanthaster planci]XP_022085146.1 uncharacterized protein LOC110976303 isoform X1 [Acanthaster planci]